MKIFKIFLLPVAVLLIISCTKGTINGSKITPEEYQSLLIDSTYRIFEVEKALTVDALFDHNETFYAKSNERPDSRDDLEKMRMVVKMYDGDKDAGIKIPGFGGVTLGKKESNLNVYYIETSVYHDSVYGCGYSLHYLFKKVKSGISINNLPSVAASAQLNNSKTQVYYSMQTYGIKGDNLVAYFKPTINKNFNVEGYGIMQSSIDGIHNILQDSNLYRNVKFKPELLKFIKVEDLEQVR